MIVTAAQVPAESGTHVHLDGLCADCGSAWPCERADVSAFQPTRQYVNRAAPAPAAAPTSSATPAPAAGAPPALEPAVQPAAQPTYTQSPAVPRSMDHSGALLPAVAH